MRLPRDSNQALRRGKSLNQAHVYLDGEFISHVHEVDDQEGWVTTLMYSDIKGRHPFTQKGVVEIRFPGDTDY